jgi:acyl-CoA dehydrogenase
VRLGIVMRKTNQAAASHEQQSMILVPLDSPGITILRDLTVFGYNDREGHCEIVLDNVRVPADSLLGTVGGGFAMSQARLGPGRIHKTARGAISAIKVAVPQMAARVIDRAIQVHGGAGLSQGPTRPGPTG